MFFGYESESHMRKNNPVIADYLISIAEKSVTNVSTRGKTCVGTIDGKEFMYSNGTKDNGFPIATYRAKLGEQVFKWLEFKYIKRLI